MQRKINNSGHSILVGRRSMFTIVARNRSRCHRGDHTCQLMVEVSKLFSFLGKIHEALRGGEGEGWWAYGEGCVVGVMWAGWD